MQRFQTVTEQTEHNTMKTINSAQNEQLKQLNKLLNQSKTRRQLGLAAIEGVHLLDSLLQTQQMPLKIYIPEHRLPHPDVQTLIKKLPENLQRECCIVVANGLLQKITTLNQADDIISVIKRPTQHTLPEQEDCVVLENVQDPGNIGTVLRSAAAAGIRNIVLNKGCADAFSPKVLRAGMGAHFLLNIVEQADLLDWATRYQHPILITLLNQQSISLYHHDLPLKTPCAWVFGNEGSGVSPTLAQHATYTVKIPMLGKTDSLNIAMAATVCLFEQMRQRLQD